MVYNESLYDSLLGDKTGEWRILQVSNNMFVFIKQRIHWNKSDTFWKFIYCDKLSKIVIENIKLADAGHQRIPFDSATATDSLQRSVLQPHTVTGFILWNWKCFEYSLVRMMQFVIQNFWIRSTKYLTVPSGRLNLISVWLVLQPTSNSLSFPCFSFGIHALWTCSLSWSSNKIK